MLQMKNNLKNSLYLTLFIFVTAIQPCFAVTIPNEILVTGKKFILAMIGVVISSIVIFIGLSLYNKFFHNPKTNEKTTYDANNLEPAKNLDDAVSNFLNRTKM